MSKFRFEVQRCIDVIIEGDDADEARRKLIDNLDDYAEMMVDGDCNVSMGELLEDIK